MVPWATSLPVRMMAACVHICSTSASRWEETKTVVPSAAISLDQRAHLAGALRVEPVGRLVEDEQLAGPSRAAAMASRWRMPSE